MGMRISFELNEDDLKHFRLIMRQARQSMATTPPEDIVAGAEHLLSQVGTTRVPDFVQKRLVRMRALIAMLDDHEWRLPQRDCNRVLNALAYFCDPEDLIPDSIPGLGFLDDAIMIELVVRDLRHEIEAYEDFCRFRREQTPASGFKARSGVTTRDQWLARRRDELQSRMRRRRERNAADDAARGHRPIL